MIQVQGIIAIFALVFKITQSNIHFRKGGGIPERNKTGVPMCCPQGGEAITSLIVISLKSRTDRHKGLESMNGIRGRLS